MAGVHFAATMAQLAKLANKFAVVWSFQTNNGDHNIQPFASAHTREAGLSAHFAGATHAGSGTPTTAVLYLQAVNSTAGEARGDLSATGPYSA